MSQGPIPAGLVFDPVLPVPVVAAAALVLLLLTGFAYARVGRSIHPRKNACLLILRAAGICLVLALLLRPSRQDVLPPPVTRKVTLVAVDTSRSMNQSDAGRTARLDAALRLLIDAGLVSRGGEVANSGTRFFEFSDDVRPVTKSLLDLIASGETTRLNRSVTTLLRTSPAGERPNGLILLTDGHDQELVNPVTTAAAARAARVPIFAVPLGQEGDVRDVSVRIVSSQPYCYVGQQARLTASLRFVGCEFEDVQVQVLRQGRVVETRRINADVHQVLPVNFEVTEPEIGQYEYEVRAVPVRDEVDPANNSAITYLNVIDQRIRVLLLEGEPNWDTTFLQRSLMRNDKFDVEVLARIAPDRVHATSNSPDGDPKLPVTANDFGRYDIVILGRAVNSLLDAPGVEALDAYVRDRSGAVVFTRGRAFGEGATVGDLEPVIWGERIDGRARLEATAEGRRLSAFHALVNAEAYGTGLPDLLGRRPAEETRPLAASLAVVSSPDEAGVAPAVVHRRYGNGQVLSVGVDGLWRWGLNPRSEGVNTPFDRFWDQMFLWLLAGRDFVPSKQYSFRLSSANLQLGEQVGFRLFMREPDPSVTSVPMSIDFDGAVIARMELAPSGSDPTRLTAEFLPERKGRYRATARFPDGSTQESRFIVYLENLEETEVATDVAYLRRLCESSGGRVIAAAELGPLVKELAGEPAVAAPKIRIRPIWNAAWVFYVAGFLFGTDWFLRRRWGLC